MRTWTVLRGAITLAIAFSCTTGLGAADAELFSAKCMRLAEQMTAQLDATHRDGALAVLAETYARLGDFERIEPTVARMADDKFKAQTLLRAEAMRARWRNDLTNWRKLERGKLRPISLTMRS